MKFLSYYSVVLASVLGFSSCKKENNEQPKPTPSAETIVLSEEVKSYGLFQPGSYWIYKNTNDNTLDSVYVTTVKLLPNSSVFLQIEFGLNDTVPESYHPFKRFLLLKDQNNEEILVDGLNLFRVDSTNLVNQSEIGISENSSISPVLVQNQNYGTCRRIKFLTKNYHAASQTYFDHAFEVFWKPHIGIIKMVQSGHSS